MPAGNSEDKLVTSIPIHYTLSQSSDIHLYQFPLLSRLQTPPSAELAGKRISARRKPACGRTEIHVPLDVRPDVWNDEKALEFGQARHEADNTGRVQEADHYSATASEHQHSLGEVHLRSERIQEKGAYMFAIFQDGKLHLQPFGQTLQFRPALNYLDVISRRAARKQRTGSDSESDSDDGPPPDPDEPPPQITKQKKDKKKSGGGSGEAREVTVTAKKTADDKGAVQFQGGISAARRDMLSAFRKEEEEPWQEMQYCTAESVEARDIIQSLLTTTDINLDCKTSSTDIYKSIIAETDRQS